MPDMRVSHQSFVTNGGRSDEPSYYRRPASSLRLVSSTGPRFDATPRSSTARSKASSSTPLTRHPRRPPWHDATRESQRRKRGDPDRYAPLACCTDFWWTARCNNVSKPCALAFDPDSWDQSCCVN